nr:uncharacterized protein LOC124494611 [Dermatophagoides farinae]
MDPSAIHNSNGPSQGLVHVPGCDTLNGTSNVTNGPSQDQIFFGDQVPIFGHQHVPISVRIGSNGPSQGLVHVPGCDTSNGTSKVTNGPSQDQILNNEASIGKKPLHFCERCNQSFNSKWNLKRHNKRIHDVDKSTSKNLYDCCLCGQKYSGYLAAHLKSAHGIEIQVKNLKFKDFEMFKSFLEKTEEETCSNYSTRRIERDSNQQVITANYICSRRGTIPANRSERKRAAKSIKTIKIGNICPSQISLTRIKDGTYTAKWTTTHVGHELDMKFCRLPNKHKELIAHYLKIGLQPSVIKKKMRNLLDNSDKITMAQMVTTKYLNNIKKQFNIKDIAEESLSTFIDYLKSSPCSVLYFKDIGKAIDDFHEDDFLIILQANSQKDMMKENSEIISIDSTHDSSIKGLILTTIMCLDKMKVGYPCAFLLSNRVNYKFISFYFQKIKINLGQNFKSNIVMTDMEILFSNAWKHIFGNCIFLYCSFHVKKAFNQNLNAIISDKEIRDTVRSSVMKLMTNLDPQNFENEKNKFLDNYLHQNETTGFAKYMLQYYLTNDSRYPPERWAYCHRTQLGINTNMIIENFHKKLKYQYMDGKKNRNVTSTLKKLVHIISDYEIDYVVRINRRYIPTKVRYLRSKHAEAKKKVIDNFKEIDHSCGIITLKYWSQEKKRYYVISINSNQQPDCEIKCDECKLCLCQVSCNCHDFLIRNNFCIHIHLAYRKYVSLHKEQTNIELQFEDEINPPDILDQTVSISYENDTFKLTKIENVFNGFKPIKKIEKKQNDSINFISRKQLTDFAAPENVQQKFSAFWQTYTKEEKRVKNTMTKINDIYSQSQQLDEDQYNELVAHASTIFPHLFKNDNDDQKKNLAHQKRQKTSKNVDDDD